MGARSAKRPQHEAPEARNARSTRRLTSERCATKAGEERDVRILVYGAGVLGCELAHELTERGNQVVLLARGSWRETIDREGLIVQHVLQRRTTTDRLCTISELAPTDEYDLMFVVMQANQVSSVLPSVAANASRCIVFVGNNGDASAVQAHLAAASKGAREVAFGFQGSAGHRECDRVVSLHATASMTVGGLNGPLSPEFAGVLLQAFSGKRYRLTRNDRMDAWLKCHLSLILPVCYVCYATNGCLSKATKVQCSAVLKAAHEGLVFLESCGLPLLPAGIDRYFDAGVKQAALGVLLFAAAKTAIGRLAASDHALRATEEMCLLDGQFAALRLRADGMGEALPMPFWDGLREAMPAQGGQKQG